MKYSKSQMMTLERTREEAQIHNSKLLGEVAKRYGIQPSSQLVGIVKALGNPLDKLIVISSEDFNLRWPELMKSDDHSAIKLGKRNTRNHISVAFVCSPEFEEKLLERADMFKRNSNVNRLCGILQKITGQENPMFRDFVLNVLPADIPESVKFDGSRPRISKLAFSEDAKVYPYPGDDSIFAVIHCKNGENLLSIFVDGLDYKKSFANHLQKKLDIPMELATRISAALPHDEYYKVRSFVDKDIEHHVTTMARVLGVKRGDTVNDLLQGPVDVIVGAFSKKLALDVDDELPSAILVNGKVNLYMPAV